MKSKRLEAKDDHGKKDCDSDHDNGWGHAENRIMNRDRK